MRSTFRLLALTLLSASVLEAASLRAAANRPNLILIMADDFGYECVTSNGGQSYQTPNLDSLASNGLRFENCHVQPLCTPTRVQLMTGRYNIRNYINFGTLPRTEITFGQLLKMAGYATGICGKWQLGPEIDSPQHFGFDKSCLWQQTRRPPRYANADLEYNGIEKDFSNGEYGPELVNNFALEFITENKEKPFFLYYPMILTHNPFQPTPDSPDWDPKTDGENKQQNPRYFADMTAYMDKLVGRIVAKLDELGIRDNTLLIFLGDNGTNTGITSRFKGADYKGGKGSTAAQGTHVPLIVNWPAVIKKGRVCGDLISSTDFLPTICSAAGVAVPATVDGISFLPQLRGEVGTPREWLYTWYSPRQRADLTIRECAFDHHYKLYRDGRLFDIARDPLEKEPIPLSDITASVANASEKLQHVLDQFTNARPAALGEAFRKSTPVVKPPVKRKGKSKVKE
jgi:arylsulfatase A